jgi:hypothetical protein
MRTFTCHPTGRRGTRNQHNPSIFRQIRDVSDTQSGNLRQNWKQRGDSLITVQHLAMLCYVDQVGMASWASGLEDRPARRIGQVGRAGFIANGGTLR